MTADETESGMTNSCPKCSAEVVVPEVSVEARPDRMPIASGEIGEKYEVLGVVFFALGTRGQMAAEFSRLKQAYAHRLAVVRQHGQLSSASNSVGQTVGGIGLDTDGDLDLAVQHAGASFRSDDMETAFHIAVSELQVRASRLGANVIVGFRYDMQLDSHANVVNFFAGAYGTAVRTVSPSNVA